MVRGLSETEREWSMRSQSSYYGYSHVQRNVTGSPASVTVTAQPSHYQRPVLPKFGAQLSRLVPVPHLTVHLADSRSHGPITLAYESITHTSFIGSTHAIYREADQHRHVRIAFFRFPFVNLAHIASHPLIVFSR